MRLRPSTLGYLPAPAPQSLTPPRRAAGPALPWEPTRMAGRPDEEQLVALGPTRMVPGGRSRPCRWRCRRAWLHRISGSVESQAAKRTWKASSSRSPTRPGRVSSAREPRRRPRSDTDQVSTPPDQPAGPMHGTAEEQSVEAPGQQPWPESQGGLPATEHDSPPVGPQPEFVDVTTGEPRIGGEPIPQPGHQPSAVDGSSAVADVDSNGGSNTSTVTRQAEAGEVDLRDTPTSPHSVDVSRETSAGGGEGMEPGLEDEAVADEAAIAVREAVSRAAAEAGVDVSRETSH